MCVALANDGAQKEKGWLQQPRGQKCAPYPPRDRPHICQQSHLSDSETQRLSDSSSGIIIPSSSHHPIIPFRKRKQIEMGFYGIVWDYDPQPNHPNSKFHWGSSFIIIEFLLETLTCWNHQPVTHSTVVNQPGVSAGSCDQNLWADPQSKLFALVVVDQTRVFIEAIGNGLKVLGHHGNLLGVCLVAVGQVTLDSAPNLEGNIVQMRKESQRLRTNQVTWGNRLKLMCYKLI